jgi:hypothetical protein
MPLLAINASDKLLALCGWVFEYISEPVYQHDPRIFYEKDFHRFIAMFCYLWFQDERSEAANALAQFQAYMRSKDISLAPNPTQLEDIGLTMADVEDFGRKGL